MIFIKILYTIQNEEQQLQCSALPDDEGKEGSKGGAHSEACSDSETYHYAAYRHRPTILRIISVNTQIIYYTFLLLISGFSHSFLGAD